MKVYLGFDDTDHHNSLYGTGKLVRWFQDKLPEECTCLGVVRQQLLVAEAIPFTSHNSSACMIVEMPATSQLDPLIAAAVAHIEQFSVAGSDPGLCVVSEGGRSTDAIITFGQQCTHTVSTQKEALAAAHGFHLSGHGGTNDGIIGASAAVGLTLFGWAGRYIELDRLRDWPEQVTVAELYTRHIKTLSIDRNARVPAPKDTVITNGWLRPRRMGHHPVLLVSPGEDGQWINIDHKKKKKGDHPANNNRPAIQSLTSGL